MQKSSMNLPAFWCTIVLLLSAATITKGQTQTFSPSLSNAPSTAPTFLSAQPSAQPSVKESAQPSDPSPPSANSEFPLKSIEEKDITITLTGVLPLDEAETAYFVQRTQEYVEFYYNGVARRQILQSFLRRLNIVDDIFDVTVNISNISMNPPLLQETNGRRLGHDIDSSRHVSQTISKSSSASASSPMLASRKLLGEELRIEYDQTMIYRYSGETDAESLAQITNKLLIQDPFNTITRRDDYITFLKGSEPNNIPAAAAFQNLDKVTPPEIFVKPDVISLVAIIAIVAGGVAFLLGVGLLIWWRKKKGKMSDDDLRDYDPSRARGGNRILPE